MSDRLPGELLGLEDARRSEYGLLSAPRPGGSVDVYGLLPVLEETGETSEVVDVPVGHHYLIYAVWLYIQRGQVVLKITRPVTETE